MILEVNTLTLLKSQNFFNHIIYFKFSSWWNLIVHVNKSLRMTTVKMKMLFLKIKWKHVSRQATAVHTWLWSDLTPVVKKSATKNIPSEKIKVWSPVEFK